MYNRKVEKFVGDSLVETKFKFLKEGDTFLLDGLDKVVYTATGSPYLSEDGVWGIEATLSVKDTDKNKTSIVN